jgi:hypothetical protein
MMAGGEELEELGHELEEFARADGVAAGALRQAGAEFEAEAAAIKAESEE